MQDILEKFSEEVVCLFRIFGKKWALIIVWRMMEKGSIRFNELKKALPGISSTMLSKRLLELQAEGLKPSTQKCLPVWNTRLHLKSVRCRLFSLNPHSAPFNTANVYQRITISKV